MRRVLIVAYYFPPLGGIGSLRARGFAAYLPEYGWEPTVVTPRAGAYYRDPDLDFPENRVVRTPSIELSRTGKRLLRTDGDDVVPASVGGVRAALRIAARSSLYFPDSQIGWYGPALATGYRALRHQRFDAVFSSSFPITGHLIARRLHRWMSAPWVAEFRDPWSEMLPPDGRARKRAARLEHSIARESDGVVMTSPTWAAIHSRAWDRPVTVIPNGHDGVPHRQPTGPNAPFTLTYLGSFHPSSQRLDAVWSAVRRLRDADGASVDRLRFVGALNPSLERQLSDNGLGSLVEVTGFLPHAQAMAALESSSALLVAGPYDARGILGGHIVAKLFEYLATGLPIVYVGDRECDAAELLAQFPGCHLVATDDIEGVEHALRSSRGQHHERDVGAFSRRALAGRLAELLDEVACPN